MARVTKDARWPSGTPRRSLLRPRGFPATLPRSLWTIGLMRVFGFFLLVLSSISAVSASVDRADFDEFLRTMTEMFDLDMLDESVLNDPANYRKITVVHAALANTREIFSHNLQGASGNRVLLHRDGHKEVVLDSEGKLVEDCANTGSYIYFPPHQKPLKHFTFDVLPWLVWGNCDNDPTSKTERTKAYLMDLEAGMKTTLREIVYLHDPNEFDFDFKGDTQALSLFLKAMDKLPDDRLDRFGHPAELPSVADIEDVSSTFVQELERILLHE